MEIKERLVRDYSKMPERILQFGEGNFLRGFADWIVELANENGSLNSSVVIVKPIDFGNFKKFKEQDNKYTLIMRGLENNEAKENIEIITSISRTIDPYEDYLEYEEFIKSDDLKYVISNTTEAGIVYENIENNEDYPSTFPAKVTKLLYTRYKYFNGNKEKGLLFFPVELIDDNATELKNIVIQHAKDWKLEEEFINWINECNNFSNTLVDRIVTGYPADTIKEVEEKLGYEDKLIVTSETYNLWVIEGTDDLRSKFPISDNGSNIVWTEDVKPYKKRKVRILNGAHTSTVLAAYLSGFKIVRDMMEDEKFNKLFRNIIEKEVIPTIDMDRDGLVEYTDSVESRFLNPYIDHKLLDISLNSVSKFRARCLCSLLDYYEINKSIPENLAFSLAALIRFYKVNKEVDSYTGIDFNNESYKVIDNESVLSFFEKTWKHNSIKNVATEVLSNIELWGQNLNELDGLNESITKYLYLMDEHGISNTVDKLLRGETCKQKMHY